MTARMRLISEAYKMLYESDHDTSLTIGALRRIVKSGVLPTMKVGRKTLLNYDALLQYLSCPQTVDASDEIGTIRKID